MCVSECEVLSEDEEDDGDVNVDDNDVSDDDALCVQCVRVPVLGDSCPPASDISSSATDGVRVRAGIWTGVQRWGKRMAHRLTLARISSNVNTLSCLSRGRERDRRELMLSITKQTFWLSFEGMADDQVVDDRPLALAVTAFSPFHFRKAIVQPVCKHSCSCV